MKTLFLTATTAIALLATVPGASIAQTAPAAVPVGDAVAGAQKTQMCAGCHAIEGWRTAFPEVYKVPKLGGQHAPYSVKALQAYKSGDRNHPTMRAIAASLSDKDMNDLAAFYSQGGLKTAAK